MQDRNEFDRETLSCNITSIKNGYHDNHFSYGFGDTQATSRCGSVCSANIKKTIVVLSWALILPNMIQMYLACVIIVCN